MWIPVVEELLGLLDKIRKDRIETQNKKDQALSAIIAASNETKIYLTCLQKTFKRNRKTEEKLSRLWATAAVPLRQFNKDLAQRCLKKSDYWINPERYTKADITSFRIGIEQVYNEAKDML